MVCMEEVMVVVLVFNVVRRFFTSPPRKIQDAGVSIKAPRLINTFFTAI